MEQVKPKAKMDSLVSRDEGKGATLHDGLSRSLLKGLDAQSMRRPRSLSRHSKPASLNLVKSNGSTTIVIAQTPQSTDYKAAVPSSSGTGQLRSLPSASGPLESAPGAARQPVESLSKKLRAKPSSKDMGNTNSRGEAIDSEEIAEGAHQAASTSKRHPTDASLPSKETIKKRHVSRSKSKRLVKTPGSTRSRIPVKRPRVSSAGYGDHRRPSDQTSKASTSTTVLVARSPVLSRHLPPTPPNEVSASDSEEVAQEASVRHHGTPPLQSPRLPTPSPLPEETPSKYGLRAGSAKDTQSQSTMDRAKHRRSKSSDVLNALSKLRVTGKPREVRSAKDSLSPPTSGPSSPASVVKISPAKVNQSPTRGQTQYFDDSADDDELQRGSSADEGLRSVIEQYSPVDASTGHRARHATSPSTCLPSIKALVPTERPKNTTSARLSIIQVQCLHQHRHWRLSKDADVPVPCSLCFSDDVSGPGIADERLNQRWSCTWCALRVCLDCRGRVELCMGRDPDAALTYAAFRLITSPLSAAPSPRPLMYRTPPPMPEDMSSATSPRGFRSLVGSMSVGDLRGGALSPVRTSSLMHRQRPGTSLGPAESAELRGVPVEMRGQRAYDPGLPVTHEHGLTALPAVERNEVEGKRELRDEGEGTIRRRRRDGT